MVFHLEFCNLIYRSNCSNISGLLSWGMRERLSLSPAGQQLPMGWGLPMGVAGQGLAARTCPSTLARSRAPGGALGQPQPLASGTKWGCGPVGRPSLLGPVVMQSLAARSWRLALLWCHWGWGWWTWGEWNRGLGHGQSARSSGLDGQGQAGLAVPSGPWQRRQEDPKMWLEVESDNLVKVLSSSTLQVLSHAIMHRNKEAKVCLSSPGTQQSHIFPSGGSLLLTS